MRGHQPGTLASSHPLKMLVKLSTWPIAVKRYHHVTSDLGICPPDYDDSDQDLLTLVAAETLCKMIMNLLNSIRSRRKCPGGYAR